MRTSRAAFTLIELLVVIGVIVLIAALLIPVAQNALKKTDETKSVNNLRQIGTAVQLYANDNNASLPSRVMSGDKWPILLIPYLDQNPKVYAEPNNPKNYIKLGKNPLNNSHNYTSYVLNGFNDLGALEDEAMAPRVSSIASPSQTILMTAQDYYPGNFYMDYGLGEHTRMLNTARFHNGSYYLFADGSARFVLKDDYDVRLWLVDKTAAIP